MVAAMLYYHGKVLSLINIYSQRKHCICLQEIHCHEGLNNLVYYPLVLDILLNS